MTTLVSFLGGRKPVSGPAKPSTVPQLGMQQAPAADAAPAKPDMELDNELFSPIATQLGQENETVRNLLMDAEHKIGELEIIKRSIGKLVDPVSKTLRAYEESKSEKLSLQSVLNNTRLAYSKLRDDLSATEKKAAGFEAEAVRLKDLVAVAQQSVAALERTKAGQVAELNARRNHIAEMQRQAQQQGADLELTRDENRKLGERIVTADKRTIQLEGQVQATQQKAMQIDHERGAVQASLDKALGELAQTARRLSETDKTLVATQSRLKAVEAALADAQAERGRLSAALDEANQLHIDEVNRHNSRFEALQARANLTENLLEEARQTLMARADEIRTFERRVDETSTAHGNAGEKLEQFAAELAERDLRIGDLEQAQAALAEQNRMLANAVTARENAYNYAQQKIQEQSDLVQLLESEIKAGRDANELQIEQLEAQLQREKLERSMAEGALEAGRKDVSRLLRELGATEYQPLPSSPADIDEPQAQDHLRSAA